MKECFYELSDVPAECPPDILTWMLSEAAVHGLTGEVLDTFVKDVRTIPPTSHIEWKDAAWCALYEWDI